MAKTLNPVDFARELPTSTLRWAQSLHKIVNGGVDMGVPTKKDATGNYNTFSQGNASGVLVRIGAHGSTGNKLTWAAGAGTPVTIQHGLVDSQNQPRQPIGVHLVASDKDLRVWQPTTPTTESIFLAPSDPTANATVYVF